jgi:hypothetical protein
MANSNASIEATRSDPSFGPGTRRLNGAAEEVAWLREALSARDDALRLQRDRFARDLDAAGGLARSTDAALGSEAQYASKLLEEYLAASERLFAVAKELAAQGRLHTP